MTDLLVPVVDAGVREAVSAPAEGIRKGRPEEGHGTRPVRPAGGDDGLPLPHRLRHHAPPVPPALHIVRRPAGTADRRGKMAAAVLAVEPDYIQVLQEPLTLEETPEYQFFSSRPEWAGAETRRAFLREFDDSLDGWTSKLVDIKSGNEAVLARAVREGPRRAPRRPFQRRSDPAGPRSLAEPAPGRDAQPVERLEALPDARPPRVHVPEEDLPHGGLAGPAPPDDAGFPAGPGGPPDRRSRRRDARSDPGGRPDRPPL